MKRFAVLSMLVLLFASCVNRGVDRTVSVTSCEYARYFDILDGDEAGIISISPYNGHRDTLKLDSAVDNIVCMSSSNVAALAALGADSLISAVSGIDYISNEHIRARAGNADNPVYDVGYEASLDYERILSLDPDILVTYTVSGAEPPYLLKLRELGIPVLVLHDHLEDHPLARAEYIRLFGVLSGRRTKADSVFLSVKERYQSLCGQVCREKVTKVLLNIPYGDIWYVPGEDSYMSCLIRDAGGEVLGAKKGTSLSGTINMEKAYTLSAEADIWLNPGHCRTRTELASVYKLFPNFGPMAKGLPIYNNTLRTTPEGGNDFWESGAMRPDLILEDLMSIFGTHHKSEESLKYHFELR